MTVRPRRAKRDRLQIRPHAPLKCGSADVQRQRGIQLSSGHLRKQGCDPRFQSAFIGLAHGKWKLPLQAFNHAVERITSWRAEIFRSRVLMEPLTEPADPRNLSDLQEQVLAAKKVVRAKGLPEGQP